MTGSLIATIRGHSFHAGPIGPHSVVADLGAHKGEFSREVNRRFGCRCHAVEALPSLYADIGEDGAVKKYNFAMAGSDGPVTLFAAENPEANSIASGGGAGGVVVQGMTLGAFMAHAGLERIDLLKMDIEGAEIALLESADEEVLSRIAQLTVEFHDFVPGLAEPHRVEAIKEKMRALGFYVIKFSGRPNTDVLFVNKRFCRLGWRYWYMKYLLRHVRGLARMIGRHGNAAANSGEMRAQMDLYSQEERGDAKGSSMIAHPGHLLVAYHAAQALQEAGLLSSFETGYYFKEGRHFGALLKMLPAALSARLLRQLRRRTHDGLAPEHIGLHPAAEIVSVLIARSRLLNRFAGKAIQLRNEYFDAAVGRLVRRARPSAIVCYDSSALKSFEAARDVGALSILDQVVGHIRAGAHILAEEAILHPEFADTMGEIGSRWAIERCSREAGAADKVLAASEYVRDTLLANGVEPSRIALCPYGVDVERFRPGEVSGERPFRFLFMGQIGQRKGIKYLLEAFKAAQLADAELVLMGGIAGSGAGLKQYEGLFRHVRHVPYGELPAYYRSADVFVYPSLHEGSALAIYEALASGLPVITTHNSGSVVRDGVEGYIVPIRDVDALREKMTQLHRDGRLRKEMSERARLRAESHTWRSYRQRLAGIVRESMMEKLP